MTTEMVTLPIIDSPSLNDLELCFSITVAEHLHGNAGTRHQKTYPITFTIEVTDSSGSYTKMLEFSEISSLRLITHPLPPHWVSLEFTGLTNLENTPSVVTGFYIPRTRHGEIALPLYLETRCWRTQSLWSREAS